MVAFVHSAIGANKERYEVDTLSFTEQGVQILENVLNKTLGFTEYGVVMQQRKLK
jgi:hypothetical protein